MTLSFSILISDNAKGELRKLPKEIQQRIYEKLVRSQENPFFYFSRLKGRPDYKLRAGDYRVVADIKSTERAIEITKVGHRRNVYE